MPQTPSSLVVWLKEWARLQTRRSWLEPRPVYVAAGLSLTVALLLLVVVSGLKPPSQPSNQAATNREIERQETAQTAAVNPLPAAVKEREAATKSTPPVAEKKADEKPRRPLAGDIDIRLAFGWQLHPLYGDWRYHPGVDIAAASAVPVRAVWSGQVSEAYDDGRYGLTVIVHSGEYDVYYSSLASATVAKGQEVAAGAVLGAVGQAPAEPFPHLHLMVKKGGEYIDPQAVLARTE